MIESFIRKFVNSKGNEEKWVGFPMKNINMVDNHSSQTFNDNELKFWIVGWNTLCDQSIQMWNGNIYSAAQWAHESSPKFNNSSVDYYKVIKGLAEKNFFYVKADKGNQFSYCEWSLWVKDGQVSKQHLQNMLTTSSLLD